MFFLYVMVVEAGEYSFSVPHSTPHMGYIMKECAKVCPIGKDRDPAWNNLPASGPEHNFLLPSEHTRISTESDHPVFFKLSAQKQDNKGITCKIILPIRGINGMLDKSFDP